jgi:hypothetical protein
VFFRGLGSKLSVLYKKARFAQYSGFSVLIIMTHEQEFSERIAMVDDGNGKNINIPVLLIS